MRRVKKIISSLLMFSLIVAATGSCTLNKKEKVEITVSSMMYDDIDVDAKLNPIWNEQKERIKRFEKKYPYIKVNPSTYQYDADSFVALCAAKQCPTFFRTWFTEVRKVSRAGLAIDISDVFKNKGYDKYITDKLKQIISPDGSYYAFPAEIYSKGLLLNAHIFRKAGLVDSNNMPLIPKNWDEFIKYSLIIKEKTGAKSFTLQNGPANPGWEFMNIAWSYGVDFIEEQADGTLKANFDTQEMKDAVQLMHDMRWKYDILYDEGLSNRLDLNLGYVNGELAMAFCDVNSFDVIRSHTSESDLITKAHTPAGPGGRKELIGGAVYMISSEATPEQIDACIKWAEFNGYTPEVNDDVEKCWDSFYDMHKIQNYIVGIKDPEIWKNAEWNITYEEIKSKYANIEPKYFEDYNNFNNVDLVVEESYYTQELYRILTNLLVEVFTNRDCDIDGLIKKANSDFQNNYLNLVG